MGVIGGNSSKISVSLIYILQTEGEIPNSSFVKIIKIQVSYELKCVFTFTLLSSPP